MVVLQSSITDSQPVIRYCLDHVAKRRIRQDRLAKGGGPRGSRSILETSSVEDEGWSEFDLLAVGGIPGP